MMGDRGAHTLDPIVTALQLRSPSSVEATVCGMTEEVHPLSSIVTFKFPSSRDGKPVRLTWYEGTRPPCPDELDGGQHLPAEGGAIFKGSKGKLVCGVYGDSPRLLPESQMKVLKQISKTIPRVPQGNHQQDWVRAIKNGEKAGADFAYSGPLSETCLLGNVAKRVDARIQWDPEKMQVSNLPAANQYIRETYRQGWSL